ncbi:MAG: iron-containing alcohol dehydrogenase [Candidatus Weimeria sp.]|nr:iron-containing alcohol dehydrogenase [Lachnospiraceae bacterium]MEE3356107.1 iron-containing alcohol dehydrogenase [Candidatus Weimeria sp.]
MAKFTIASRTTYGEKGLSEAIPFLQKYGKRALIVTGRHVGHSPMMEKLQRTLDEAEISYVVFDGITGEPTDTMISEGTRIYKDENCGFVIGMGGGSSLDSAKAIAAMSANCGKIADYAGKEITGHLPPIVAIPTTAGTGSETTCFTVVTDTERGIKLLLKGDALVPDLAVLDPAFSLGMPAKVTAGTGLDALTHAVEAYTSKKAFPLTDAMAVSAVKRILTYLPRAYRDGEDKKAREEMMLAAYEAGVCINNSSVTIVHGMSRPIGALFHIPHGISNAMLLDVCLSHVAQKVPSPFASLAREVGLTKEKDDRKAAEDLLAAIRDVVRACEVPTLADYGVDKKTFSFAISKMAKDAMDSGSPGNTRCEVTMADCEKIYHRLLEEQVTVA